MAAARTMYMRPVAPAAARSLAFILLAMVVLSVPFLMRVVSNASAASVPVLRRAAGAIFGGTLIAGVIASVTCAVLGRGRIEDVISVEGGLIFLWCAVTVALFVASGLLWHYAGLWDHVK